MLFTTHLLVTLIFSRLLVLSNQELIIALIAGVGIDIDHIFVNNKWIQDANNFIKGKKIESGVNQHSLFQEFLFGTSVASIIGLLISHFKTTTRWWILPVFVLIHIATDAVMKFYHSPFAPISKWTYQGFITSGSVIELIISIAGLLVYFLISKYIK